MIRVSITAVLTALILLTGCKSYTPPGTGASQGAGSNLMALPRAIIYTTSGDYDDNVPITLNMAGTQVLSYPAPSDLAGSCTPVKLADGYLLDRRGINANTAFTTYTYSQYRALRTAPTPAELFKAVIPGATVLKIVELPMTQWEAARDIDACNRYIADGLKGCKVIYTRPTLHRP